MRIDKDGSVFRCNLKSGIGRFETRISFAVNSHGDMNRPRLEIEKSELTDFFRQALPHIQIEDLIGDDNIALQVRWETVRQLIRLMSATTYLSQNSKVMDGIPHDLRSLFDKWPKFLDGTLKQSS